MRTPVWCRSQAALAGPACDALAGELLAVNALFRLRQAQGVLRLGQRHGDARLEAACRRGPCRSATPPTGRSKGSWPPALNMSASSRRCQASTCPLLRVLARGVKQADSYL